MAQADENHPPTRTGDGIWAQFVRHPQHGSLPILLLCLTIVTGLVDAASILGLGRVFVANMTGNIVFIGFALVGAPGFSLLGSMCALAGFLVGAIGIGAVLGRIRRRRTLLLCGTATEFVFLAAGLVLLAVTAQPGDVAPLVVGLLAVGLGARNAIVRKLAVPDLTTTVLTMSITGIGADLRNVRPDVVVRRLLSVLLMLAGAALGALVYLAAGTIPVLAIALALVGAVAIASIFIRDGDRGPQTED